MSPKHFETFYWPSLKKLISGLVNAGLTPFIWFEGTYTTRLEYLTELPKGKVIGFFEKTDMIKAKEILGDIMCIGGGMPVSLLQVGTPQQIRKYAKKLIDKVGEGGGFVMSAGSALDEANPQLLKIWVDFTKQYGKYKR